MYTVYIFPFKITLTGLRTPKYDKKNPYISENKNINLNSKLL